MHVSPRETVEVIELERAGFVPWFQEALGRVGTLEVPANSPDAIAALRGRLRVCKAAMLPIIHDCNDEQ